jgi:hypothetical protein
MRRVVRGNAGEGFVAMGAGIARSTDAGTIRGSAIGGSLKIIVLICPQMHEQAGEVPVAAP